MNKAKDSIFLYMTNFSWIFQFFSLTDFSKKIYQNEDYFGMGGGCQNEDRIQNEEYLKNE